MKFRTRMLVVLAALIASATTSSLALAQEVTLRLHHYLPPAAFPHARFLAPWAEKVERESNGRIKVQIYPAMALGGTPLQLVDQLRDGVVDIIWTVPGFTAGRFPRTEIFELPFVHTNAVAATMALQDYQAKHLRDEYADYQVLLMHTNDGLLVFANKPVRRIEDYAGMKVRTPSRAGSVFLRAVGATPVGAPVNEVPQMLSKGVIDGALLSYEIALPLKAHQLTRNQSEFAGPQPRIMAPVFLFAMNKQTYAKLPDDLKRVIDANSGRNLARAAGETWIEIERIGKVAAQKEGNTLPVMEANEVERVRAAVRPEIDKFLTELGGRGIDAKQLYDDARAMVQQHTTK